LVRRTKAPTPRSGGAWRVRGGVCPLGLAIGMLCDLVRKGLAAADQRSMRVGRRMIEVAWLTITAEGRRAIAKR
jgi:hypothetical protein